MHLFRPIVSNLPLQERGILHQHSLRSKQKRSTAITHQIPALHNIFACGRFVNENKRFLSPQKNPRTKELVPVVCVSSRISDVDLHATEFPRIFSVSLLFHENHEVKKTAVGTVFVFLGGPLSLSLAESQTLSCYQINFASSRFLER